MIKQKIKESERLYIASAKILLRKLKTEEKLYNADYLIMQILLEHLIRGNNEE